MSQSFDNLKMNVIETAANGAVNEQTIFHFQQNGNIVSAKYSGGGVRKGFLAGKMENNSLGFKYAQQHDDGNIYGGNSTCEIIFKSDSIVELVENFNWDTGKGKNVFRTLDKFYTNEEIRRLTELFENSTLPPKEWNHHAHLLIGLRYCKHLDFEEALSKMKYGIISFNNATGTVNSEASGYHETITRFWLKLIFYFVSSFGTDADIYNSFINSRYAKKDYIFNFYSNENLFSKKARLTWIEPTIQTIRLL